MYFQNQKRNEVFEAIELERYRQNKKWRRGQNEWKSHPQRKYLVLAEEVGEVAEALLNIDKENLRDELIQVAAVAVAWLESFDSDPESWDADGCG